MAPATPKAAQPRFIDLRRDAGTLGRGRGSLRRRGHRSARPRPIETRFARRTWLHPRRRGAPSRPVPVCAPRSASRWGGPQRSFRDCGRDKPPRARSRGSVAREYRASRTGNHAVRRCGCGCKTVVPRRKLRRSEPDKFSECRRAAGIGAELPTTRRATLILPFNAPGHEGVGQVFGEESAHLFPCIQGSRLVIFEPVAKNADARP